MYIAIRFRGHACMYIRYLRMEDIPQGQLAFVLVPTLLTA